MAVGKVNRTKRILKLSVIVVCLTGFFLQTMEFLNLYWTYPTVVDIQVSVPSKIEIPGITFCNSNGIYPSVVCSIGNFCLAEEELIAVQFCRKYPIVCEPSGNVPSEFQAVVYQKFTSSQNFNAATMAMLRKPLDDFFTCAITSGDTSRKCQTNDAIMGSYYSDTNIFNFCFTIYSLWSQPDKKILKMKKSDRIAMTFYTDISDRLKTPATANLPQRPKYSYPSSPSIQLTVHSPLVTTSPFSSGNTFLGGKEYKIKLKQHEKHLLPPPYQTNCTNYMIEWLARQGKGPINQRMMIEECKYNLSIKEKGCVPFYVDYPHNETVCKYCEKCANLTYLEDTCSKLQQIYNHPCDYVTYEMFVEEKLIYLEDRLVSRNLKINESMVEKVKGHNCSYENVWSQNCQIVKIEINFDDFEITNLTYNPKFESLELFSVIGGYMGMYLGVSIVAVYDFGEMIIKAVYQFIKKRKATKKKLKSLRKTMTSLQERGISTVFERGRYYGSSNLPNHYRK